MKAISSRSLPLLAALAPLVLVPAWAVVFTHAITLDLDWQERHLAANEDLSLAGLAYLLPIVFSGAAFLLAIGIAVAAAVARDADSRSFVATFGGALLAAASLLALGVLVTGSQSSEPDFQLALVGMLVLGLLPLVLALLAWRKANALELMPVR